MFLSKTMYRTNYNLHHFITKPSTPVKNNIKEDVCCFFFILCRILITFVVTSKGVGGIYKLF